MLSKVENRGRVVTVLVVEDEASVREITCELLESVGYTVLSACSGEQALDISENYPGHIDVVISDVLMPGMGGTEVVSRIRAHRGGISHIFMSGYLPTTAFVNRPSEIFLQKPFNGDELIAATREALASGRLVSDVHSC